MLLTTCPNCSAQFKVQPEQLNVRQGRVMCGRCRNVFNAFQSLMRVPDSDAYVADSPEAYGSPVPAEVSPNLTDAIFLREEPLPLSQDFSQTDFASDIRSPATPSSPSKSDYDAGLPVVDSPVPAVSSPGLVLPADADSHEPVEAGNPLLAPATRYRQPAKAARAVLWSAGAVTLLVVLTAQLAYAFRSTVVQNLPQLRPAYVSACEWAGCSLSWGRDDGAIRIEASDLIELPGKSGRILLTATVVNRSTVRQDLPVLELKLTDNANQVILSRILIPHEYLGRVPAKDEALVPNVEMYVNLSFELAQKAQASGYGVRAFYQ